MLPLMIMIYGLRQFVTPPLFYDHPCYFALIVYSLALVLGPLLIVLVLVSSSR